MVINLSNIKERRYDKKQAKKERRKEWHEWFAWKPVKVSKSEKYMMPASNDHPSYESSKTVEFLVWLKKIYRRYEYDYDGAHRIQYKMDLLEFLQNK